MMAYFYQDSTYRDMNDAPRTLTLLKKKKDMSLPNLKRKLYIAKVFILIP